jgi:hypothetical protein
MSLKQARSVPIQGESAINALFEIERDNGKPPPERHRVRAEHRSRQIFRI